MSKKYKLLSGLCAAILMLVASHLSLAATITYTYDSLNRVTKVDYGDRYTEEYAYDAAGNRLTLADQTAPPVSTVTSPSGNTVVVTQNAVTISGTANDDGGPGIQKVEVSIDGGSSWHTATGTTSWVYTAVFSSSGTYQVMVRATDNLGNVETAPVTVSVTVNLQLPSSLTPYDDFSSPLIDLTKWQSGEFVREIDTANQKLISKAVTNGSRVQSSLNLVNPDPIAYIEADVALIAAEGDFDPSDVNKYSFPNARVTGNFYNDGTGSSGSPLGDVQAVVRLYSARGSLWAGWALWKGTSADGSTSALLGSNYFPVAITLGQTYKLSLKWDPSAKTFTFGIDGTTQSYHVSDTTINPPGVRWKSIGTDAWVPSGAGYKATVTASFDNVVAKDASNTVLMTDDFSSAKIDETKWTTYESVREVKDGKLRLKARSSQGSTSPLETYAAFKNPASVNSIQADITPLTYTNEQGVLTTARVQGRFFNDGTPGGGYLGDISAQVYMGGTGSSPVFGWRVLMYTSITDVNSNTTIASGTFTQSVVLGNTYRLLVSWNGSTFTFKVDDEEATYTPTTAILPPNMPIKMLGTRISSSTGQEATIEALFDNVMTDQTRLFAYFTGDGLYTWTGSTWTLLTKDQPSNMVVSGSSLHASFAAYGLYHWDGSNWTLLTKDQPSTMVGSGSTLYADFPGWGVYSWNGTTWTKLTGDHPQNMIASGSMLYAYFTGDGLYSWNGATWTLLTTVHQQSMVASGSTLYAFFTGDGLYSSDGTTWTLLTKDQPTTMRASGSTLYANFAAWGVYSWNGTTWTGLTSSHPTQMAASGSTLYADFSGDGFYTWNGSTWTLLTKDHPANILASGSSLYADFAAYGLYSWDGSTWTKLTGSHPAIMVADGWD